MVSETVGNLIQAAAEELAIVDSGNSLSTAEQASAVDRLQRLIDRSNIDRALIYGESYSGLLSLTAQKQSYTIGIDPTSPPQTADLNVARPARISRSNVLLSTSVRKPVEVTTDPTRWARIRYQAVYGPPLLAYYDQNFSAHGFATLWFYLIPDQSYQWEFWSWIQNPVIASTSDTINYPPGYASYWLYALAKAMAPMFGRTVPQSVLDGLAEAKAAIERMNTPSPELARSSDFTSDRDGLYNWLSGEIEF